MKGNFLALTCLCVSITGIASRTSFAGIGLSRDFVAAPLHGADSTERIENEYIFVFHQDERSADDRIDEFLGFATLIAPEIEDVRKYHIGNFLALKLTIAYDLETVKMLGLHEHINFIDANLKVNHHVTGECVEQDTGDAGLWGLTRVSSHSLPDYEFATYSYAANDGEDVYAYIIDTGVYAENVEFEDRVLPGFTAPDLLLSEGSDDLNGHGTHVSGTVAGKTYGLAKKAMIIPCKVLNGAGSGTTSDVIEGIQFAADDFAEKTTKYGKKAKGVANMSLGTSTIVQSLDSAVRAAITDIGLPFAIAAGNEEIDACTESPGNVEEAFTVGASDITDTFAYFSDFGPCVDIIAPGVDVLSSFIGSPDATAVLSGTSMSSPHVAGVVARYISEQEEMPSPSEIDTWLKSQATEGVLEFPSVVTASTTTNKLLYMSCAED